VSDLVWCEQVRRWGLRGAVRCRRGVRTWDADDGVGACAVLMCWGTAVERRRQRRPVHALSHFTRSAHVRPRRPAHEGRPPLGRLLPTVRACRPRRDRVESRHGSVGFALQDSTDAVLTCPRAFCQSPEVDALAALGATCLACFTTPPDTAPGRLTCCLVGVCCPVSSGGLVDSWVGAG
jgi:hypothetical protein